MPRLYLVALGAVALVALLVWFAGDDAPSRARTDSAPPRAEGPRSDADHALDPATPPSGSTGVRIAILDPAGRPADGAHVEVRGPVARRFTTDARGVAMLGDLPVGLYDLFASRDDARAGRPFARPALGPLDLGTLTLADGVRISGRVLGAGGAALAGARVEALHADGARPGADPIAMVRRLVEPVRLAGAAATGDDGRYEIVVPRGVPLALRVGAPGYAPGFEPARAWTVPVADLDFVLGGGRRVRGIVLGSDGRPLAGARASLVALQSMLTGAPSRVSAPTGPDGRFDLTARAGPGIMLIVRAPGHAVHFTPEVEPGDRIVVRLEAAWTVLARAAAAAGGTPAPGVRVAVQWGKAFAAGTTDAGGLATMELIRLGLGADPDPAEASWKVALVGGGRVPTTETRRGVRDEAARTWDLGTFALEPGGVCRGRVLDAVTGEPVAGAEVYVGGGLSPDLVSFARVPATSDTEGRYELSGVPLASTMVYALHPDYLSDVDPARDLLGGSGAEAIFPAGQREIELDVRLRPAGTVTGRVVDGDGNPVAGALVRRADRAAEASWGILLGLDEPEARTDADGRFVLGGLDGGDAVPLVAEHRDYAVPSPVAGRAGGTVTIRLGPGARLEGRVLGVAGEAVAGVRIGYETQGGPGSSPGYLATRPPSVRSVLSDDAGRFVLRNLPVGEARVTLAHPDYRPLSVPVVVREGDPLVQPPPFRLDPGLSIEGLVVHASGEPLAGVRVGAHAAGDDPIEGQRAHTATDENGRFVLRGLAEGRWRLAARHTDHVSDEPVVESGSAGVRIVVLPQASLRGRVVGDGQPVERAEVRLMPEGAGEQDYGRASWSWTDAEGRFTVTGLDPRVAYRLRIAHRDFLPLRRDGVAPGTDADVFLLERGLGLAGTVAGPAGAPIEGAIVVLSALGHAGGDRSGKRVETGADGRFSFLGLRRGRYRVSAHHAEGGWMSSATEVSAGEASVLLTMRRGGVLAGEVVAADGTDPGPARVEVLDAGGRVIANTYVFGTRPAFVLGELEPGRYRIRVGRVDPENPAAAPVDDRVFGPFDTDRRDLELVVDW